MNYRCIDCEEIREQQPFSQCERCANDDYYDEFIDEEVY